MKNLGEFLDAVKAVTGSDYKTAKMLEVGDSLIGNWRGSRSFPSNAHIIQMCDRCNIDLGEAIRAVEVSRAKKAVKREVYRYAGAAAAAAGYAATGMMVFLAGLALVVTLIMTPTLREAAPILGSTVDSSVYYVK